MRLAARYLRHRLDDLHPYEVQAVLLNACNLKCAYCSCPQLKTSLLTTEQWLAAVRRLGELGTLRLKWQGGEPTMRRDFRQLCADVQRAGILCAVVTNGTYIAGDPSLLDHLDEVVFSLDSVTPELTDAVRGQGVHAQVLRAIDVCRRRPRPPRLFINMVVTQSNLDEVEAMLVFCEERRIGLNAQPVIFGLPSYDDTARSMALTGEQTRALFHALSAWKRQGRRLMFAASSYDTAGSWPDYATLARRRQNGESACPMGRVYVHIEPNGDIHPCVQHTADFQPKNIARDGLDEALRHVRHHNCGSCFSAYLNERKALFGLRPQAVVEYLRRG
jgi:MoaA/NifB/PqqE/SkfB family radical SAM enzyme